VAKRGVDDRSPARRPRPGSRSRARVLLGIRDMALQGEILDYLDRDPRLDIVGAVSELDRLARLLAGEAPHATVLCPQLCREVRHPATAGRAGSIVVVAEELSVQVLREAIDAGAQAVFGWPEERAELARTVAALPSEDPLGRAARARVIGVYGARGGAGVTFVATHVAATLADRGRNCALIDLDTSFAGLTVALGIDANDPVRDFGDLVPVADELSLEHVEDALYRHPRGFSVLLGAAEGHETLNIPVGLCRHAVGLLAGSFDAVVLHLSRALDDVTRAAVHLADQVLLVSTLDLFSLYGARRAVGALGLNVPSGRCRLVINRISKASVTPADVRRVLGIDDWIGVRFDSAVARAQDKGELLPIRARRAGADLRTLVSQLDSPSRLDDTNREA
jgi:Flp pilus assembly CpaE family ATPase